MRLQDKIIQDLRRQLAKPGSIRKPVYIDNLKWIISQIKQESTAGGIKEENKEKSDKWILAFLKSIISSQKKMFQQTGKMDNELVLVCESYLPAFATENEIKKFIQNIDFIQYSNKKEAMRGMGLVMKYFGGNVDGNLVKKIYMEILDRKFDG